MSQKRTYLVAKRTFDIASAAIGIVILGPLFLAVAAAIKLSSPGPVLYTGKRVGKDGKLFKQLKFRTMVHNADKFGNNITSREDPRITPLGHLLRRAKIDELPQLLNVIRGEMSIVGPRPEGQKWVDLYSKEQLRVLDFTPGITDPVQILFRHEEDYLPDEASYPQLMDYKVNRQLEHLRSRTFWGDIHTIFRTLIVLFQREPSDEALKVYESLSKRSADIGLEKPAQDVNQNT